MPYWIYYVLGKDIKCLKRKYSFTWINVFSHSVSNVFSFTLIHVFSDSISKKFSFSCIHVFSNSITKKFNFSCIHVLLNTCKIGNPILIRLPILRNTLNAVLMTVKHGQNGDLWVQKIYLTEYHYFKQNTNLNEVNYYHLAPLT